MGVQSQIWSLLVVLGSVLALSGDGEVVDLYSRDQAVVHLDHTNFNQSLFGHPNVWVVEFYNSWCGHCQLYAPTWLKIAQQTAAWRRVARIGAINCARDENLPICRKYDVAAYPWVKFFRPRVTSRDLGQYVRHGSVEKMLSDIVDFVTEVQNQMHPPAWPSLELFTGSLSELLQRRGLVHAVLLEETADSRLGRMVTLDVSDLLPRVQLVRTLTPPAGLQLPDEAAAAVRPLLVVYRRGSQQLVTAEPGQQPRRVFSSALRRLVGAAELPEDSLPPVAPPTDDPVGRPAPPAAADGVYLVDLENAVRYALGHEVVGQLEVDSEEMAALRDFLVLLVDHLPARRRVRAAVAGLLRRVQTEESVSGEQLEQYLEQAEPSLPPQRPWAGCRGSQPQYRGYPCSLWTLFHTLTVAALRQEDLSAPSSVLPAIHGYVKYFFSCAHCSQHFQEMALEDGLFNVTNSRDAALWLWRAHNRVNQRLAGDPTEDPQHPKVQFPTERQCPACSHQGEYIEPVVLAYLKNFYAAETLRLGGLPDNSSVTWAGSDQSQSQAGADQSQSQSQTGADQSQSQSQTGADQSQSQSQAGADQSQSQSQAGSALQSGSGQVQPLPAVQQPSPVSEVSSQSSEAGPQLSASAGAPAVSSGRVPSSEVSSGGLPAGHSWQHRLQQPHYVRVLVNGVPRYVQLVPVYGPDGRVQLATLPILLPVPAGGAEQQ